MGRPSAIRRRGSRLALSAAVALAAAVAGCGGDEQQPPDTVVDRTPGEAEGVDTRTVRDEVGDVSPEPTAERSPNKDRVDLERISLRRDDDSLRATFETVAPLRPPATLRLLTFDLRRVREGVVDVRYRGDAIQAVARSPGEPAQRVPVGRSGSRISVDVPLNDLTREERFKWRARSLVTDPNGEIVDRYPNVIGDVAFFPE